MGNLAFLQSLKESILGQANVKAIYGESISAHGKTVVPVAKIMYGYGAGASTGGVGDTSARGEGGEYDFGRKKGEESMSKSQHTEAQMIGALKQMEAGRKAEDVAREVGVSKHTLYAWKAAGSAAGVRGSTSLFPTLV